MRVRSDRPARRSTVVLGLVGVGTAALVTGVALAPDAFSASTDANGSTYVLTSFDGTSQFIGLNAQGRTFTAAFTGTTGFRTADLSKFAPTDPCRTAASSYNSGVSLNDSGAFSAALTSLAASSCKAKVLIDTSGVIKQFQPTA